MIDMIEPGSASAFNILFRLFELILKKVKKDSMRDELVLVLEVPILKTEAAYEKYTRSMYEYFGAGILGNIIEPSSPKETAQKIVDNVDESVTEFLHNFRDLTKYFDAHLDELREVLNPKEILIIEALIKAFENDVPDFEFLMNHGAMQKNYSKEIKRKKTFQNELKDRMNIKIKQNKNLFPFSNKIQAQRIEVQQLVAEAMARVIIEKQLDATKFH